MGKYLIPDWKNSPNIKQCGKPQRNRPNRLYHTKIWMSSFKKLKAFCPYLLNKLHTHSDNKYLTTYPVSGTL